MKEIIIKSIPLYDGKIVKLNRNLVELPNGKLAFREVVKHQQGVCIVPVIDDSILFVTQYRSGAGKLLLELPAGLVDNNESPLDAAIRELKEETKYSSAKITYLGAFYSSPGFTDELVHLYIAEELYQDALEQDEDEFIELTKYSIKQVNRLLSTKQITDMKTALGLMMYFNTKNSQSNFSNRKMMSCMRSPNTSASTSKPRCTQRKYASKSNSARTRAFTYNYTHTHTL